MQQQQQQKQQQQMGSYSQLMSGLNQQQHTQQDSMQCSEVMTVNQTNGFIASNNNLSTNSDQQMNIHNPNKLLNNDRKEYEKKTVQALQKEFDLMQFSYANEEYSYQINRLCKRISSEKHAQDIACKFPLYKMIRSIVKKFLFNELELIFFGYVLEESKWKVEDIEVRKHAYFMSDFLNITEVKDLLDYKAVLLYLILTAYGVKFYLNEEAEMAVFNAHMNTIVKDFSTLFQYWSKSYGSTSFKIIPKSLNRVYRNLSKKPTDQNKKQHEDYNALVDAIIQISPPYNNEKTAMSSASNAELGDTTTKQLKLDGNSNGKQISGGNNNNNGNSPVNQQQNASANKQETTNNNYTHSQLLSKIVEKKQQQQQQQQQQLLEQQQIMNFSNKAARQQQGSGLDSISGYQQQYGQQQQQQQQLYQQQQSAQGIKQQQQQVSLGGDGIDFSSDFGGNNGTINLGNINNNQNSRNINAINNPTNPISAAQNQDVVKRESSLLQGFSSTHGFNADQLDFLNNHRNSSNNNFNFNPSYSSLAIGGYPSFLQNIPQGSTTLGGNVINDKSTNNNSNNNNNNIAATSAGGAAGASSNAISSNQAPSNINNFGLQSSGSFENTLGNAGVVGNNPLGQSGGFNTASMAFSNGFLGQNNITNNSFTSNQAGFSNNLYSQFQGSTVGQNQSSLSNLLFSTQPKKNS